MAEIPHYRSHKVVAAAKIAHIVKRPIGAADYSGEAALLTLEWDGGTTVVSVSQAYMVKHEPEVGGYWVRYPDSYESWSPADAFEGGYTREPA